MRLKLLICMMMLFAGRVWAGDADLGFWTLPASATLLEQEGRAALERARALRDQIVAIQGARTIENTLVPYDEISRYIGLAQTPSTVLSDTHPDDAVREVALKIVQEANALRSEMSLDPRIYKALVALDRTKGLDAETSYYLTLTLKSFRNAGADKPESVRQQIGSVRAEIVKLEQQFARNIVQGLAWMPFRPADLQGMPEDFVRGHKRDEAGNILISNDRADVDLVLSYATSPEVRRKIRIFSMNRGYPANMVVLDKLIQMRHRLATLCGFSNFADIAVQDRMIASKAKHRQFLDELDLVSRDAAEKQLDVLLESKRRDAPDVATIEYWDLEYYIRVVRDQRYGFDERQARAYYPYARVKEGVLEVSSRLFNVVFQPVKVPVWHPMVEMYEVLENRAVIGRIYLDMFPRKNKYQHFRAFPVRRGVLGRQLPEVILTCNFPAPTEDDPALMAPQLARIFFHEFGHALHGVFAGRQRWAGLARAESDFMETPSQLLEEWYRNPKVLASFARHHQTGQPIPEVLVERMEQAERFGQAVLTRRGLWLASISLSYAENGKMDTDAVARELYRKYFRIAFPEGSHWQSSFPHLGLPDYAGTYYTYQWSLVIAKDLFTKFDRNNLLDPGPAKRYRETVLNPGGSMPAAKLVENFLGRPFNMKAYQAWLQGD